MKNALMLITASVFVLMGTSCSTTEQNEPESSDAVQESANLPAGEVSFTAPEGWVQEQPESGMRKAQYSLPGAEGSEDAELAVFFFPNMGGSVQANLDRWYGQFKQADGSPITEEIVEKKTATANNLPVTIVYLTGTYLKPQSSQMMGGPVTEMPDYAMWAAIAETSNGPWFFKATGPQATIDFWRDSFGPFVSSFKVQ